MQSVYKNGLTWLSIASAPALLRLSLHACPVQCLWLLATVSGCYCLWLLLSLVVTASGCWRQSLIVTVSGCYCLWLLLPLVVGDCLWLLLSLVVTASDCWRLSHGLLRLTVMDFSFCYEYVVRKIINSNTKQRDLSIRSEEVHEDMMCWCPV